MFEFIIASLAVYGASSLLVDYDGAGAVLMRLRNRYPNSALKCVVCTSFYVSGICFVFMMIDWTYYLTPLAIIGVIAFIERITE